MYLGAGGMGVVGWRAGIMQQIVTGMRLHYISQKAEKDLP